MARDHDPKADIQHPQAPNQGEPQSVRDAWDAHLQGQNQQAQGGGR